MRPSIRYDDDNDGDDDDDDDDDDDVLWNMIEFVH